MPKDPHRKVDLNAATREEISAIPIFGSDEARNIMAAREKRGTFRNLDEVIEASGLPGEQVEELRKYATVYSR